MDHSYVVRSVVRSFAFGRSAALSSLRWPRAANEADLALAAAATVVVAEAVAAAAAAAAAAAPFVGPFLSCMIAPRAHIASPRGG